jgi:hypothetical protein
MAEEVLTAYLVHPSNHREMKQRFTPLNTFMFAGMDYSIRVGTWVLTQTVRTTDPFDPDIVREHSWNWNLTYDQLCLRLALIQSRPHDEFAFDVEYKKSKKHARI